MCKDNNLHMGRMCHCENIYIHKQKPVSVIKTARTSNIIQSTFYFLLPGRHLDCI